MTLLVQKPTGAKLLMRQSYVGTDDPDAAVYIAAVEAADGQSLESAVQVAIHSFVKGCKADGIWPAIKASCILSGARTLAGALVPLVGTAPTNVGPFVSGDYDRKTGLNKSATGKRLNTNRNNNADPQNSFHMAVYATTAAIDSVFIGAGAITNESGVSNFGINASNQYFLRNRCSTAPAVSVGALPTGLIGVNRSNSADFTYRTKGANAVQATASQAPYNGGIGVFATAEGVSGPNQLRFAFYSIGESLDLTLLDARVTQLITTFAAVIP